jgi:hypothetical protein
MTGSLLIQRLTDDDLWARVARQARCAGSALDPDQWYPVSVEPAQARHEAAAAIAVCTSCPVRAQCLELSLRHWDIGQHGVWGGLIATDRVPLRRRAGRPSRMPQGRQWPGSCSASGEVPRRKSGASCAATPSADDPAPAPGPEHRQPEHRH